PSVLLVNQWLLHAAQPDAGSVLTTCRKRRPSLVVAAGEQAIVEVSRRRAADSTSAACPAPPSQYSQSPRATIGMSGVVALSCAVRISQWAGASGSRFSSSPLAGHMPQTALSAHRVHLVGRVAFFVRSRCRNPSQPATKPWRTSYLCASEITQMLM